ncbi:hypothetical protein, partial [Sutterella sp.]|uniref:hypothetical protein n=1 Tax=Sutterella sp. TaxID=1981025 RepID=UPI0026DF6F27
MTEQKSAPETNETYVIPTLTEEEAHHVLTPAEVELLTGGPRMIWAHMTEGRPRAFAEKFLALRHDVFAAVPEGLVRLDKLQRHVLLPHSPAIALMQRDGRTLGPAVRDPLVREAGLVEPIVAGEWGFGKVCLAVSRRLMGAFISTDWWRKFPPEYLVARMPSWCLWVSARAIPHVPGTEKLNGFFTGVTVGLDGFSLFIEYVRPGDRCLPGLYFEFPLKPGKTLGEIVDGAEWRHYAPEALLTGIRRNEQITARELRKVMSDNMRATARRCISILLTSIHSGIARDCWLVRPD